MLEYKKKENIEDFYLVEDKDAHDIWYLIYRFEKNGVLYERRLPFRKENITIDNLNKAERLTIDLINKKFYA